MMKALSAAFIFCGIAAAHDLYLIPDKFFVAPGESLMISVHNGDSFPASEGATDPSRLLNPQLSDGAAFADFRVLGKATHGFARVTRTGSVYASVHTMPRTFELPAEKFESYLKEEGLSHVLARRKETGQSGKPGRETYSKYAKVLLTSGAPDRGWAEPVGLTVEIIPEADPSALQPGQTLPVRVLFRGQPAGDVQMEKAWAADRSPGVRTIVGRTGADGRIRIPIDKAGRWRLHTLVMEATKDASVADWESFWASLTFEVKATPATGHLKE